MLKNIRSFFNKPVIFSDSSFENLSYNRSHYVKFYKLRLFFIKFVPIILFLSFLGIKFSSIVLSVLWFLFAVMFFDHRSIFLFSPIIRIWFGVPGSGKTSMAALLTRNSIKGGYNVLSNVEIKGAYKLDSNDLGVYDMSFDGCGCHVVYDEGSLDFDNRNFKNFAQSEKPRYFALHRHMNNMVDVFSQGYDIDKRIRDRAGSSGLFYLRKVPLKGFVCYRAIKKVLFIKKDDKQMIDGFDFKGLPRFVYSRSVWDSFDTLDMSMCPKKSKTWEKW